MDIIDGDSGTIREVSGVREPQKHDIFYHPKTKHNYRILGVHGRTHEGEGDYVYYENVENGECFHRPLQSWMSLTETGAIRFVFVPSGRSSVK